MLGGRTPLEALLGGSLPLPPATPTSVLVVPFEDSMAEVPDAAGFRGAGFGVFGFGELIVADWVRACPLPARPIPVPILVPEPDVAVALGLVMVAIEPELDEVVGRVIPKGPDTDRVVVVGGDRGVALDTVGTRARRGCLRLDIVDVVDFVAVVDVVGDVAMAAPDPTLLPEPLDIPLPTSAPVPTSASASFPPSRFSLVLASRLSPPEAGGFILLLLVPLLTLAILLIPLPLTAVPMLLVPAVREADPGAGNAPFVDGIWIIETGRCFGPPTPAPLVALLPADVPTAPVVVVSFISLAVLVGFRSDRVRSSALGCKEGVEEDMVPATLLLGGGDWMVLLRVSVIHS